MPLQDARSVADLYAEVREHDLVLVPDAPLASALNRRLDRPFFGTFATTPRRLAAGRRETAEDRTAFLELVDEVDASWKATTYAIGNVLQCWEHEGTVDAILDYDAYADATTRAVVDAMGDLRTTSGRLTDFEVADDTDVAVVGAEQFTRLERSVLPDDYESVDPFTDDPHDLPPFNVFDSASAIVDALLDTVTTENAENVAVVLDGGSRYSSLVEGALEAAGIPFYGGPGFVDDPDHRAFLQLLRVAFEGPGTTVGDVAPILSRVGERVPVDHQNERLDACDLPAAEWLVDVRENASDRRFADILSGYETKLGRDLPAFRAELDRLGLLERRLSRGAVADLATYLDAYEVPVDRENDGVLLADAKSSGYVDRPAVFYLGLDESWTHSAPKRPWIDTAAQYGRYLERFQMLLQSGDQRYFLVQDTAGGQPVTPCLYFDELLDEDFERFSDLDAVTYTRHVGQEDVGFAREAVGVDSERLDTVSQSSLNTYVNCPRDHLFDDLLEDPDADYLREGSLFHDFAEFYATHPETVDDAALASVVDLMLESVEPFYDESKRALRRRTYRIGLETIVEFLDERSPWDGGEFLTSTSGWGTNVVAEHFGRPVDSPVTEHWFENEALGIKGKIDLIHDRARLLDYKSGRKKRASQVVKHSSVDPIADTPDFQAALYLCHYRTERPDEPLEFTFFHFLETLDDVVRGEADVDDALTTVSYVPSRFSEWVRSEEAFKVLLDGYTDCQETFEDLGYEAYEDVLRDRSFPESTDREELRSSAFADRFTEAVEAATGDDVDAEKGCDQAIRALNRVRRERYFEEDLDAFEVFVEERLEEMNRRRAGDERFPIDGPGGEPNYRRVDNRDLLLEDGGGPGGGR